MEIFFDGITIMFLGKSGIYTSIHVHPFVIAFLIFAAAGSYAHHRNRRTDMERNEPIHGPKVIIGLVVWLVIVVAVVLIPLNSLICGNPIVCSWHPRADNPKTWTVSPNRIVNEAFEQALR